MWQRLGQLCASRAIVKFLMKNMQWAGFQHVYGIIKPNLIPTSVRTIVHYKSQPLLHIFALQLQRLAGCLTKNLLLAHAHSTFSVQLVYRNTLCACASRKLFGQATC